MFYVVFKQLQRTPLEATVAIPLVFNYFFAAMLILLTFSNALIAYAALFRKNESAYLLSSPLTPLDVVTLKYTETLFLASWALVLLGMPLMVAMAGMADHSVFYVLFLAFFLAFIPIPGAFGLLLAWAAARCFPRRIIGVLSVCAGVAVAAIIVWGMRSLQFGDDATELWLRSFLERMSIVESAFLPNNWVASGIDHAIHGRFAEAGMYLCVTIANALFVSWLAVMVVAKHFDGAFDRASSGRGSGQRPASNASGGLAGRVFFYLPLPLRLIAAKDLRTFVRDPLQWSQLVILFGLLALYLTNMPTLRQHLTARFWYRLIPFLNLCAISLILATFTCRFVFPLVSLEGQKLWLVGLLPMPRGKVLHAKSAFAMTVTLVVAVSAMGLATVMLQLDYIWTIIHLIVIVAVCFGLCGFAVGIGARLPMLGETNTGRIANGLGGTINLLASVALVTVTLAGVGVATWRSQFLREGELPDLLSLTLCYSAVVISLAAGSTALKAGARHFDNIEA
jgi:ABC-2 type transport system permease protein